MSPQSHSSMAVPGPSSHKNGPGVQFKRWYESRYCGEDQLRLLTRLQQCLPSQQRLLTLYFSAWSWTGEAEFYTVFIASFIWAGITHGAYHMCTLMCVAQYITSMLKDSGCCGRPPSPPVEVRGRTRARLEYGFPSTHASLSVVFAYTLYMSLAATLPEFDFIWTLVCTALPLNVSFSRLYLGMHWPADVVSGWGVAAIVIASDMLFLQDWILGILTVEHASALHYILVLVVAHIFPLLHVTPFNMCPCYLDSLRLIGGTAGLTCALWLQKSVRGVETSRVTSDGTFDAAVCSLIAQRYILQLLFVIVIKETTSFVAIRVLRHFYLWVSTSMNVSAPQMLQNLWYMLSHTVRYANGIPCTPQNQETPQRAVNGYKTKNELAVDGLKQRAVLWLPRTHKHWWLWEEQRYLISYFVLAFFIVFVCPIKIAGLQ
ncbi:hypothetical protein TRVL_10027 [Trypanosoma vivax]|uniref:Phosphatidic acid phosphatase type 2/haloperoxidase domain-containing protein n=1 Tax=Trypanosoma vivax (strain Y486) TaxID=1055687 RepID=G0U963_TRYVY|nr:hypothetical protein TRVL_10027 [Trypanosoma vivax]CCC54147.1 hypothetical protein TVY486_1116310 [Trypanosoma vivax Y486]